MHLFLVFATLFVAGQVYTSIETKKLASNEVFFESDKAEMALRMTSSFMALAPVLKGGEKDKTAKEMQDKFYQEAEHSLGKAIKAAPQSSIMRVKRIVYYSETRKYDSLKKDLAAIRKIDTEKARQLSRLVTVIYEKEKASQADYNECRKILTEHMPPGWYSDVLLVQLERVAGHKKQYESQIDGFVEKYRNYLIKMTAFFVFAALCGLFGVFVILVQLFMLPRKPTSEEDRARIQSPVNYGWKVVYGVFIAWLSCEYLVVPWFRDISKDLANIAVEKGSLTVAFLTALLYLSQNLPSLFFIWFIAFRSHGVKFLDGIRLRWKTEKMGPVRLIFAGVLTWYAAIPLVVVSGLLAQKFLNSQGSSNPIVAVVLSSVKDSNPLAVVMFLITLGVLPALCEETLFRGFLYTSLRRRFGVFLSIFFSAALFSLAHFDLGGAVPLFVLGCLFAFVFERTKSLIPAMVAHCMWNSGTFLMALTMLG